MLKWVHRQRGRKGGNGGGWGVADRSNKTRTGEGKKIMVRKEWVGGL